MDLALPAHRGGMVLAIAASALSPGMSGCSEYHPVEYATSSDHPDVRSVTVFFERHTASFGQGHAKEQWNERRLPDGTWIKEGAACSWSRHGRKLEDGSYRNGKREGLWIYWHEDGSLDTDRSGQYEADVRISDPNLSPLGDYPVDTDAPR